MNHPHETSLTIFALTKNGARLGNRLSKKIDRGALLSLPERFATKYPMARAFTDFKKAVRHAFHTSSGLVFIMATGIVVRTIAPLLKNKTDDPAVVVMDEKGRHVISLLSGHLGGANALAQEIAKVISATPVITTATDVNQIPCVEDIAKEFNLIIEDVKSIKVVNAALVNGGRIAIVDEDAKRLDAMKMLLDKKNLFRFYQSLARIKPAQANAFIIISHKSFRQSQSPFPHLLLRPKDLVVGIGCDRGVTKKEVEDAYFFALKKAGFSPMSVRNVASIDVKKDEKGLVAFAKRHKLNIEFYTKDELAKMPLPSGFSRFVMGKVGVGGVCEPAALRSAGTKKIWLKKQKIGRVTVAVAKAPFQSLA